MRLSLEIPHDVFAEVKTLADRQGRTVDDVVTEFLRIAIDTQVEEPHTNAFLITEDDVTGISTFAFPHPPNPHYHPDHHHAEPHPQPMAQPVEDPA
ncbi:MAG: hypothetical protein P4L46_14150 [Fimbriimonas sp.]|nr:hypothetical protein [Fimbriimonas sp.]